MTAADPAAPRPSATPAPNDSDGPNASAAPTGLEVSDLLVSFRDAGGRPIPVVDLPRWSLPAGGLAAVTGPSGAGKSTLLYALAGLLRPDRGRVAWGPTVLGDLDERGRDRFRRRRLGFVFQDFHLVRELSPLENVLLPAWFEAVRAPTALAARAKDLLDRFGVPRSRRRASDLSRGEQQRVALARALLHDPPVLLADEPTASLDAEASARVVADLTDAARDGGRTVIAVSHDPELIERFPVRLRLDHGRVTGPTREVDSIREGAR